MALRTLPALFSSPAITPEKAWWLGVLLGDGNVYWNEKSGDYRVSCCGAYSTVKRWTTLLDIDFEPQKFKRADCYQGYLNGKILVEYLRDTYGLCGPKAHKLPWIEVPEHHRRSFLRGLWDSDGSITIERRRHKGNQGNDTPKLRFGVTDRAFVERVRDLVVDTLDVSKVAITPGKGEHRISWSGSSGFKIAEALYAGAPEHIRNEERYEAWLRVYELKDSLDDSGCVSCGREAQKQGYCTRCWWATFRPKKTGVGTTCLCGKSPIVARGLCSACYSRDRRKAA